MKTKNNTQIICTLGPASAKKEIIEKMMQKGMTVARINMSHGTYESLQEIINELAPLRKQGLKLLIDTKGPEMRIGTFEKGKIELKKGQMFTLSTEKCQGTQERVFLKYKGLLKQVKAGDMIFANDAKIQLKVVEVGKKDILCKTVFGGTLSNNKSLNVPGVVPHTAFLSEVDKQDILFGIKNKMDYLALSFVSTAQNVVDIKKFLKQNKYEDVKIIAKIENSSGVLNAGKILDECYGLMVARGDLGVEIPLEKVPVIQKKLISLCNVRCKFVITATEMLESMTTNRRPTRAEVNDIANAIYDETNATMLSGETSVGKNPVLVVETMSKIIAEVENHLYNTKNENLSF